MSDGLCLEHAYQEVTRRHFEGEDARFVQGTVTNPYLGRSFKHAWVEVGDTVIDPTINLQMQKKKYYATFKPKEVIRVEPFIMIMLGKKFYTKEMVAAAIKKDKELMAKAKRRK